MKKCSKLCKEVGTHNQISWVARSCKSPNVEHVPSKPEVEASCQLEHYRTKSTDQPSSYLTVGTRDLVKPQVQAASQLCFEKPDSSHSILTPVQIPLIPMKCREPLERILREKPQRKTRLTHPQSSHRDSSNSSTLILSIVTSLRGSLQKPFLTIPTFVRRPFGAWEAVRKGPISYWLMLWFVAEFGKLKKKQVRYNLVGVEAQRAQVHWVDQAWKVFCCSCIPTTFFSGLFTTWRAAERFYAESFGFVFDNTSYVVLVFTTFFP